MYKPFAASKKEEKKMTICTRNLSKKDSIVNSKKTSLSVSFWYHWLLCFKHNIMSSVAIFLPEENSIFSFPLKIFAFAFSSRNWDESFPSVSFRWARLSGRVHVPLQRLSRHRRLLRQSLHGKSLQTVCVLLTTKLSVDVEKRIGKNKFLFHLWKVKSTLFCPKQSEC